GMPIQRVWSRSPEVPERYNSDKIIAHYQTFERSVDTREVAAHLTACLESHDQIDLHLNSQVLKNYKENGFWHLQTKHDRRIENFGPFDFIINSSWEGRLKLDEQVFGPEDGNWFHRYKTAVNLHPENTNNIPNCTAIIGKYGDIIKYPSGRVYLSWYPAGMLSASKKIRGVKTHYSDAIKCKVAKDTLTGLSQFVPAVDSVFSACAPKAGDVAGGIIMARGKSDIDDSKSELHQRYRIGIKLREGYLSIDTGKYTCGPAFAEQAVNRILG
ncbi:MAG: hypothetical protein O7C75_02285, partial [Verrucomicrobia bacterium]|nr:hypothetical protein [Verrucomicrobiota bacterium]